VGTYTVTLDTRILDVIADEPEAPHHRNRRDHHGFGVRTPSVTFEVVKDGKPRETVAEKIRRKAGPPRAPKAALALAKLTPLAPVLVGGTTEQQALVRAAHENAGVYVEAAMRQVSWTSGSKNALAKEWFGGHDAARYATTRQNLTDVTGVLAGQPVTYDLTGAGCQPGWYAYTYKNTRKIWLCSSFWSAEVTGTDSKFGTLAHELTHAVSGTDDISYGRVGARDLASSQPSDAIRNADNYEYFTETLSEQVVTAPILWSGSTAYMFVAGHYYAYDVAADKVTEGPLSIASGWTGLFDDRIDAAVVWNNGKAYFFRGTQYMRYDMSTGRVDAGYPLPIAPHWPGLWSDGIDAAVMWPGGKAYFFRGSQYIRYDVATDKSDPGYPRPISPNWPGLWTADLNGGVVWNNDVAYFFRGAEYIRYDIVQDKADGGPKSVAGNWPGLP
jgi:hypothetical protein